MSTNILQRKFALPLVALIGVVAAVALVKLQPKMEHKVEERPSTAVKFITAKSFKVPPQISGFGEVIPDILLEAKSEVSGKVEYIHPQLKPGSILPKDTVVIKIEANDYQLALTKAQADLAVSKANLVELDINLRDSEADLVLAKERLSLSQKELKRTQGLIKKGAISQSNYDSQQSSTLQLRREVQNLQSQIATLPSQRAVLQAKEVIAQSDVEAQQRNLARTVISLPFTARISEESIEDNQFVSQGTTLYKAQNIDRVLVNAQFPFDQFKKLSKGFPRDIDVNQIIQLTSDTESIFSKLGLGATVKLSGQNGTEWEAKVERFLSDLDPSSRTLGIIVSVDDPYENIRPGIKPPLLSGMFAEVSLKGQARKYIVLPRDALHENELYLVGQNNSLIRKKITAETQGSMILVATKGTGSVVIGDKIITSDVFPAVSGMPLYGVLDVQREQQITDWLKEQ